MFPHQFCSIHEESGIMLIKSHSMGVGKAYCMLAAAHRQAAEDIEQAVQALKGAAYASRMIIEGSWGAAFHWIAFGCETKHQNHQESHARLGAFLRRQGEEMIAERWEELDRLRQGGWYGGNPEPARVQRAIELVGEIHLWAIG